MQQHLPIAMLLLLCAMVSVALSCRTSVAVSNSSSCSNSSAGAFCLNTEVDSGCRSLPEAAGYYARADCDAKTITVYTTANCSDAEPIVVPNHNCTKITGPGSTFSVLVTFDVTCGSAALLSSWVAYLL
jgi:exo-beta-1,3-glucanase (GH17 family)